MIHKGIKYYTFKEIKNEAIRMLRKRILDSTSKFLGDIEKLNFSKEVIGRELKNLGYRTKRIMIDGVRKYYYYKQNY